MRLMNFEVKLSQLWTVLSDAGKVIQFDLKACAYYLKLSSHQRFAFQNVSR